jgi:SPP1 gp7 family putative phage head morphogenesis protein
VPAILAEMGEVVGEVLADAIQAGVVSGAANALEVVPQPPLPNVPTAPLTAALGPPSEPPPPAQTTSPAPEDEPNVFLPAIDESADILAKAEVLPPAEYYAIKGEARRTAFTISAELTTQTVEVIRDKLAEALREGHDTEKFIETVAESFTEGAPLGEAKLSLVFRQNIHEAMSEGNEAGLQAPMVVDAFPYRDYQATTDGRVRKEHIALEKLGLDGTSIYRADDPVWKRFRPPWAWGCRCSWVALTVRQAARRGVREAVEWIARAEKLAESRNLSVAEVLSDVAPVEPEFVPMPSFAHDPKVYDPRFLRE